MYIDEKRLKQRRKELNLRQENIALACDVTTRQIQRYESRQSKPTVKHLLCIAGLLKCSHLWLLGLTDRLEETELRTDQLELLAIYESGNVKALSDFMGEHFRKKKLK